MIDLAAAAKADIDTADSASLTDGAEYFLWRSIARSLLAINDALERIDDALRNTIGGSGRV